MMDIAQSLRANVTIGQLVPNIMPLLDPWL